MAEFPWREYSADTKELQAAINSKLPAGYCKLTTDGKLGPTTCAAFKLAMGGKTMGACQSYGTVPRCPSGGGAPAPTIPTPKVTQVQMASGGGELSGNWILIGVGVLAVASVGIVVAKKRGYF